MSSPSSNELSPPGAVEAGSVEEDTDTDTEDNQLSDPDVAQTKKAAFKGLKKRKKAALVLNAKEVKKEMARSRPSRAKKKAILNDVVAAGLFQEEDSKSDNYAETLLEPSKSGNSHHMDIGEDNSNADLAKHVGSVMDNYAETLLGPSKSGNSHHMDIREDNSNADHTKHVGSVMDNYVEPLLGPSESGFSHHMYIGEDNRSEDHEEHTCWSSQKVDLGWIFVITNFVLELPSVIFDQLSSVRKPQYALLSMLMSLSALLICIVELVYKGRKEKVRWRWRTTFPWFYYRLHSHDKPFGNFKDVIGLVCALCQSIVTTIGYIFCHQHADNPIKISLLPIIFAFGLLCSKFLEKPERTINA